MTNRTYIPPELRRFVRERASGYCEYRQSPASFSTESFVIEHIWPLARGGTTTAENLAYACSGCNGRKATRVQAIDPTTRQFVPLFHPRQQRWHEHFRWSEETSLAEGLTPIGRAMVEALQLNRTALVNLRRVLRLAGEHPPLEGD